jgi:membrane protein implicated in regulation of membrane protease activity
MTAWWDQPIPDLLLWMLIAGLVWTVLALFFAALWWRWFSYMREQDERDGLPPH